MKYLRNAALAAFMAVPVMALAATAATAQDRTVRWQSMGQSSPDTVFTIAVSELIKEELGIRAQITTGRPIVRQAIDAAKQEADFWTTASSINHFMSNGIRMYEEMPEAPELFKNVRMILNYPLGAYHLVAWADTGIESLADIKGKRVYLGPPAGAATVVATQMVDGATGYKPGEDFQTAELDWNSGMQAFQDRQVDVHISPTSIPSAEVTQLATLGKIRLLGLPEDALDSESVKAATSIPGRMIVEVPAGLYGDNQVNEGPVRTIQTMVGLGTNKWMDEETVYKVTKAIFENNDRLKAEAPWMEVITVENGLNEMNAPLHMGAYRYYKEKGIEVPDELLPPELNDKG